MGEKPFDCPTCHKTFRLNTQMNVHGRIHTGDELRGCPKFDKAKQGQMGWYGQNGCPIMGGLAERDKGGVKNCYFGGTSFLDGPLGFASCLLPRGIW